MSHNIKLEMSKYQPSDKTITVCECTEQYDEREDPFPAVVHEFNE